MKYEEKESTRIGLGKARQGKKEKPISSREKEEGRKLSYGQKKSLAPEKRFHYYYIKRPGGCWEWIGAVASLGYGNFRVSGKCLTASRYSYEMHRGAIPHGLFVCHKCDNKRCVNPDHLFLGTQKDNDQDMCKKGRHWAQNKPPTTHCVRGHEYTQENTYLSNGGKVCRVCKKLFENKKRPKLPHPHKGNGVPIPLLAARKEVTE